MLNAVELEVTAHGWSALRLRRREGCPDRCVGSSISWVRWARSRWESMDIVVSSSGLQVVLELSEEFVELVTFGFWESIAFCYAHLVVSPHSG